jgi:hypothetical protein
MNFPILRESVYEYFIYGGGVLKGALDCCKVNPWSREFFDPGRIKCNKIPGPEFIYYLIVWLHAPGQIK